MSTAVRPQYRCGNERRREAVRASGTLNGIDFVEVDPGQVVLTVHFLHPVEGAGAVPPAAALGAGHVEVVGDPGARAVRVVAVQAQGERLRVTVDRPGDFSSYEVRLTTPGPGDAVPDGFDTRLAAVTFSFKAGCESLADCAEPDDRPPQRYPEPVLDLLAKDYDSFRQVMLDRLSTTLPAWRERHPADPMVALVEVLAYVADHLSAYQDAVATEAYLGTARLRSSVRRHARLLDHRMDEGRSARTFVHLTVSTGMTVPAGTEVRPGAADRAEAFATLHPLRARVAHNDIALHTWDDEECCLPVGATRATLAPDDGADLRPGDLLLLEETRSPDGGAPDPAHRQVVRLTDVTADVDRLDGTPVVEVAWARRDALTVPIRVSTAGRVTAVARGNVAVADHGAAHDDARLVEEDPPPPGPWRPRLPEGRLAQVLDHDPDAPASDQLEPAGEARPAVELELDGERWLPLYDLLGAGPTDPAFVVETEDDGTARLRFGDDELGRRPAPGTGFTVRYRVGGGTAGNLGADALDRLARPVEGVVGVRNPVPARGGTDPEPTDRARAVAPHAYRRQERAVTPADYAAVAGSVDGVQRAAARLRWTGSWYTAQVTVDRLGGGAPDDDGDGGGGAGGRGGGGRDGDGGGGRGGDGLGTRLRDALERRRMTGVDVQVSAPRPVPVELALTVCVLPAFVRADVGREVERRLSAGVGRGGEPALFHPDRLTLGEPVHLSAVYAEVLAVPGVRWVQATTFRRFGRPDAGELARGVLRIGPLEVAELASDRDRPDRGRLTVEVVGGR